LIAVLGTLLRMTSSLFNDAGDTVFIGYPGTYELPKGGGEMLLLHTDPGVLQELFGVKCTDGTLPAWKISAMDPVRIFLGDLTYNTVSLSTDANPLNIGYIAAYCNKKFGPDVEISLFKYIEDIEEALYSSPPDILGLSNYCWCERIGLEIFRLGKQLHPDVVTVWGGPNFPIDKPSQQKYLLNKSEVNIYIPLEGEVAFANAVERVLNCRDSIGGIPTVFQEPIDGCITNLPSGDLMYGDEVPRIKDLDEIPSPYLTGLLDKFFDNLLKPRIQTSRGCPFTCTFCVDGAAAVNKVNRFSLDRTNAELHYIAEHVPPGVESLGISDLNFGMYSRDLEISDTIVELQNRYGYPRNVMTTTGKNAKEKIIGTIQKLGGSMQLSMSVQSLDKEVLQNVRRKNISAEKMLDLAPAIREANLRTTAEVILGLPGDSYESHVSTLKSLVNSGMEFVQPYTLMLLNGSELNRPEEREKWEFLSKFRILPRDFIEMKSGKKIVEMEEVVVGSKTLSFQEYQDLRKLGLLVLTVTHGVAFDPFLKYVRQQELEIFQLPYRMYMNLKTSVGELSEILERFEKDTKEELWDSAEELEAHYQSDKSYSRLLDGEEGFNIYQVHHAIIVANHMPKFIELATAVVRELLREAGNLNKETEREISEIGKYCAGITHNVFDERGIRNSPRQLFQHNVLGWLEDRADLSLATFRTDCPVTIDFVMSEKNRRSIENELRVYNDTSIGRAQAIKRIQVTNLWRDPVVLTT